MASASTPASAVSQSRTPGPLGCGRPSAAGMSPARSTRRAPPGAEAASRPSDAATTVVPLPPFTDQQQVSTLTPEGRRPSRCRTLGRPGSSTRSGGRSGQPSGCSRPQQGFDRTDRVGAGGVWVPGGLHRLQSGWNGRSPFGGFDSRPPPLKSPCSQGLSHGGIGPVVRESPSGARYPVASPSIVNRQMCAVGAQTSSQCGQVELRVEPMPLTFRHDIDVAADHADSGLVVDRVRRDSRDRQPISRRWPACCRVEARGPGEGRSRSRPGRARGRRRRAASTRRTPCRRAVSSPCSPHSCRSTPCRRAGAASRSARTLASSGTGRGRRRPTRAARRPCGRGEPIAPRRCWATRSTRSTPPTSSPVRSWAVRSARRRTPTRSRPDLHGDGRTSQSGMHSAVQSSMGRPSTSSSASWIVAFLTPAEVRRSRRTRTCKRIAGSRGSTSGRRFQGCMVIPAGSGGGVEYRTEGGPRVWPRRSDRRACPATDAPDEGSGSARGGRARLQHMSGSRGWACLPWDRGLEARRLCSGEPVSD